MQIIHLRTETLKNPLSRANDRPVILDERSRQ